VTLQPLDGQAAYTDLAIWQQARIAADGDLDLARELFQQHFRDEGVVEIKPRADRYHQGEKA
jgi:hypothetical protein